MNTTSILVDILIVGIQVMIWILGFFFSFISNPTQFINGFEKSPTLYSLIFIVFAYTIGIMFEHLITKFFVLFLKSEEEKTLYDKNSIIEILGSDIEIHKFLDNHYERLRIARGTLFNLPFITISACCFICTNNVTIKISSCTALIIIITVGILFTLLAFISWKSRNDKYLKYIKETEVRLNKVKNIQ